MRCLLAAVIALGLFSALPGCKRVDDHAGSGGGGHVHRAPHGGTLIEVGEHAFNLELVRDPAAGKLTVYVLDGHAENFIRISAPAIEMVALVGGERRPLTLKPVANSATGETVGDTSQFEADAEWLKNTGEFPGTIKSLDIRGAKFNDVAIYLRKTK